MPIRRQIHKNYGTYFITFTNVRCIPLFQITNSFDAVFKFFDVIKSQGHRINAYVIMPNHFHGIFSFEQTSKSINKIIGDGKRFLAYEIIRRLKENNRIDLLKQLQEDVEPFAKKGGKHHVVFEPSFDWKECTGQSFLHQKLDYIHYNPCKGNVPLVAHPLDYPYSSARDYLTGEQGIYPIDIIS
jgi:REP element-mobilizing transposase RayT